MKDSNLSHSTRKRSPYPMLMLIGFFPIQILGHFVAIILEWKLLGYFIAGSGVGLFGLSFGLWLHSQIKD